MTEPNPRPLDLASVISEMEDNLRAVKQRGEVLIIMSGSCHAVSEDALATIGSVLHELGGSIEEQYERAFALSHQGEKTGGGRPCA